MADVYRAWIVELTEDGCFFSFEALSYSDVIRGPYFSSGEVKQVVRDMERNLTRAQEERLSGVFGSD